MSDITKNPEELVDVHVQLDGMRRDQAIRILEDVLYHAKRGDSYAGSSPGFVGFYKHEGDLGFKNVDPTIKRRASVPPAASEPTEGASHD